MVGARASIWKRQFDCKKRNLGISHGKFWLDKIFRIDRFEVLRKNFDRMKEVGVKLIASTDADP